LGIFNDDVHDIVEDAQEKVWVVLYYTISLHTLDWHQFGGQILNFEKPVQQKMGCHIQSQFGMNTTNTRHPEGALV
jgi:hypothetical protein